MFKLIIAGTRTFKDYDLLVAKVDRLLSEKGPVQIVSGHAPGADRLAEEYAKNRGMDIRLFHADWYAHQKAAGPIRNEEMAKYSDGCVCFWDGFSRGTWNMIEMARKYGLVLRIVKY